MSQFTVAPAGPLRFLVAECAQPEARDKRRESVGESAGESYRDTLLSLAPGAVVEQTTPADAGARAPDALGLVCYDAVFLTGSPLHVYRDSPEVRRGLDFMRAVFASGTPAFGSCAGLQMAVAAAGGRVRSMQSRREAGFARRIAPTDAGRGHPLLAGRPAAYDAPAIHSDEVEALPEGALHLAANASTTIQAAEIRHAGGVFWGVQYHPELDMVEVAAALRREADDLVEAGLVESPQEAIGQAALVEALARAPDRRDLLWRLGLDEQVSDPSLRTTELKNFITHLVMPRRSERGRA